MAKLDKSQYTKEEWRQIKAARKKEKELAKRSSDFVFINSPSLPNNRKNGFVLGNGVSRKDIDPVLLSQHGKIYGCNALYRTFSPDYLIAVDVKMILEINKSRYQHNNEVWTNPNKSYANIKNLNYFSPSKGWSSGPTALWLASQHGYDNIFILGFDYKGLNDGKFFNNLYADSPNYKKSKDAATFYGNWMRQTKNVIQTHPDIKYTRVITPDNYRPDELNTFDNYSEIFVEDFQKMFNISGT